MQRTVLRQIDELNRMSMAQMRKRWDDLFGGDGMRLNRKHLLRRLAYRIQELAQGGMDGETQRQMAAVADGMPTGAKRQTPRLTQTHLDPGTRLLRDWHGQQYEVVVTQDGFLYAGRPYRSLSAIAKAITGAHWNGRRFFGLVKGRHSTTKRKGT